MASIKNQNEDKTSRPNGAKRSTVVSAIPAVTGFFEDISLLDEEDEKSYQQIFDQVVAETGATSFLDRIVVKDFTDKLFEERRYKTATVELIAGARSGTGLFPMKREESDAIEHYLSSVLKIDRVINSSQAGRRALLKELRQRSSDDKPPPASKPN